VKKIMLFIDSGAHSLYNKFVRGSGKGFGKGSYEWYTTPEFWEYVDKYAEFIHENKHVIDVYANVDVIGHPEYTYNVQKYLENKWKLRPLPVVHFGTEIKYLQRYIEEGHDYIAIGGLGQEVVSSTYYQWADRIFDYICDNPARLPTVKIHGFALTSLRLMLRYPWYSVDSTAWVVTGRMGAIYVPRFKNGKWVYNENSWKITVSSRSPKIKEAGQHINTLPPKQKELILEYIHSKGYKLGKSSFKTVPAGYKLKENERWADSKPKDKTAKRLVEVIEEPGICNKYQLRDEMNIIYFQDLEQSLPEWPWPFKTKNKTQGLGV